MMMIIIIAMMVMIITMMMTMMIIFSEEAPLGTVHVARDAAEKTVQGEKYSIWLNGNILSIYWLLIASLRILPKQNNAAVLLRLIAYF